MRHQRPRSPLGGRGAFTFIEILFSVMILGVGFIMTAAIFPVAIRQTQLNMEESSAAAIGRDAVSFIERVATESSMPSTEGVVTCPDAFWNSIRGNLRLDRDGRCAWTAVYRREPDSSCAQVYILALQSRARPNYDARDITTPGDSPATLQPRNIRVNLTHAADGRDTVEIRQNLITGSHSAAVEGTYLIIASDGAGGPNVGRIYRLGNARPDLGATTWELMPGKNMQNEEEELVNATAIIIGRALLDPTRTYDPKSNPYEGAAQDIGFYTTFVRLH